MVESATSHEMLSVAPGASGLVGRMGSPAVRRTGPPASGIAVDEGVAVRVGVRLAVPVGVALAEGEGRRLALPVGLALLVTLALAETDALALPDGVALAGAPGLSDAVAVPLDVAVGDAVALAHVSMLPACPSRHGDGGTGMPDGVAHHTPAASYVAHAARMDSTAVWRGGSEMPRREKPASAGLTPQRPPTPMLAPLCAVTRTYRCPSAEKWYVSPAPRHTSPGVATCVKFHAHRQPAAPARHAHAPGCRIWMVNVVPGGYASTSVRLSAGRTCMPEMLSHAGAPALNTACHPNPPAGPVIWALREKGMPSSHASRPTCITRPSSSHGSRGGEPPLAQNCVPSPTSWSGAHVRKSDAIERLGVWSHSHMPQSARSRHASSSFHHRCARALPMMVGARRPDVEPSASNQLASRPDTVARLALTVTATRSASAPPSSKLMLAVACMASGTNWSECVSISNVRMGAVPVRLHREKCQLVAMCACIVSYHCSAVVVDE